MKKIVSLIAVVAVIGFGSATFGQAFQEVLYEDPSPEPGYIQGPWSFSPTSYMYGCVMYPTPPPWDAFMYGIMATSANNYGGGRAMCVTRRRKLTWV